MNRALKAGLFLLLLALISGNAVVAKAETYQKIKVGKMISFRTELDNDGMLDLSKKELGMTGNSGGDYYRTEKYYQFTLDEPACVLFGSEMKCSLDWNTLNSTEEYKKAAAEKDIAIVLYISPQKDNFESANTDIVEGNQWCKSIYDAGTYYVKLDFEISKNNILLDDISGATLLFQSVALSNKNESKGTTLKKARKLVDNQKIWGVITRFERAQYYKYTAHSNEKLTLKLRKIYQKFDEVDNNSMKEMESSSMYVDVYDSHDSLINSTEIKYGRESGNITVDLNRGDYYLKVYRYRDPSDGDCYNSEYYLDVNEYTLDVKVAKGEFAPDTPEDEKKLIIPKLLNYKSGTKLIKGKATSGSTVFITVDGKKYQMEVSEGVFKFKIDRVLKKNMIIKVYATRGEDKTKTRTYKV